MPPTGAGCRLDRLGFRVHDEREVPGDAARAAPQPVPVGTKVQRGGVNNGQGWSTSLQQRSPERRRGRSPSWSAGTERSAASLPVSVARIAPVAAPGVGRDLQPRDRDLLAVLKAIEFAQLMLSVSFDVRRGERRGRQPERTGRHDGRRADEVDRARSLAESEILTVELVPAADAGPWRNRPSCSR